MRAVLIVALLLLPLSLPAGAQEVITKKLCSDIANGVASRGLDAERTREQLVASNVYKLQPYAEGAMKDAIARSEDARQKLLPLLKDYSAAIEDLTYQLRVCAR